MASTNEASNQSVQFLVEELAKFQLYKEPLKSSSTPITAIVKLGKPNTCLYLHPPNRSLILEPHTT